MESRSYDNLPQWLTENARFTLWRYEKREGQDKPAKVPYQINGHRARSNDPSTFTDYANALSFLRRSKQPTGLGIGIFGDVAAVDIDHCVDDDGQLSDMASDITGIMDSYTEFSPSDKGIRILFRIENPVRNSKNYYINNSRIGLEIYAAGVTNKYVTVTGHVIRQGDMDSRDNALQTILNKYMKRTLPTRPVSPTPVSSRLSDSAVLEKAGHSAQSDKFRRLYRGEFGDYKSQSDADMALAGILAFWCGGDTTQMDRLFRQSGLMRDKWDSKRGSSTYGRILLEKVVCTTDTFYNPTSSKRHAAVSNDDSKALTEYTPDDNERYPWTDIGAGRLFADFYKKTLRYVPERKTWFAYADGIWAPDTGSLRAMELCKQLADQLLIYGLGISDERRRDSFLKHHQKWQTRRYREIVLKDAQSVHPIAMSSFDSDPYVFNCKNGTLHLNSTKFTEHRSADKLTKISQVRYDPDAACSRFDDFIREVAGNDAGKARFLQKVLGYGITGDTRYECLFVLYGATTRNGKGTLCESVLKVLGGYGCTVRPESISIKANANSSNPSEDIARLAGVRFANISEPGRGLVLNASQVKSMTGNDTLNARFLHENSFDFAPQFKLYINANYLPVINDMTLFSSGRVVIIPFDRHFEEHEQDKTLKREFAKSKNQSAILNWLVKGYQLLIAEGLTQPQSVLAATDGYRHDSDKVALFVEDTLIQDSRCEVRTSAVYKLYKLWCDDNDCRAENSRNFNQALRSIAVVEKRRPKYGGGATTMLVGYYIAG